MSNKTNKELAPPDFDELDRGKPAWTGRGDLSPDSAPANLKPNAPKLIIA